MLTMILWIGFQLVAAEPKFKKVSNFRRFLFQLGTKHQVKYGII